MNMDSMAQKLTKWGMSQVTLCRYTWTYFMKLFLLRKFAVDMNIIFSKLLTFTVNTQVELELKLTLQVLRPHYEYRVSKY